MIDVILLLNIITASATIIVPVVVYFVKRERRSLRVVQLKREPVVNGGVSALLKEIKVPFKEGFVCANNVHLCQLKLENNGNRAILKEDYYDPITIIFPSVTEIIEVTQISAIPLELNVNPEVDGNKVILTPILMNSNDKAILQIITNGELQDDIESCHVNARIKDVSKVCVVPVSRRWSMFHKRKDTP